MTYHFNDLFVLILTWSCVVGTAANPFASVQQWVAECP